jgi:glycerol-3-phosphate acyltransferase PlsY
LDIAGTGIMTKIYTRAFFHLAFQSAMLAIAWFTPKTAIILVLALLCVIFILLEAVRLRSATVNDWFFGWFGVLLRQSEKTRVTGALFVLVASLVTFGIFSKEIAITALTFLAVGDPAAAIVGKLVNGHQIFSKTLEGNLACLVACLAAGFLLKSLGLDVSSTMVIAGSMAAAFIQALPIPINDNLSIPLFSALVMYVLRFA